MQTLLLGLALVVAAPATKEVEKKPSIVGEWEVETAVLAGMPQAGVIAKMTFSADGKCTTQDGFGGAPDTFSYKVDTVKAPGNLDLIEPGGKNAMLGIFKFDKDALTICIAMPGERPDQFVSFENSSILLLTLKRNK